jgi:hypothetical protein
MIPLPPYATRDLVQERLLLIFPEGTANRTYCTRELAASTVFALLYVGAVHDPAVPREKQTYLGPVHVYRMTFEQAALFDAQNRIAYRTEAAGRKYQPKGERWYADNTREPIRDETLRDGLIPLGAVITRKDVATTAGTPRYQLQEEFAGLFDPSLISAALEAAITAWQQKHLSRSALMRISLGNLAAQNTNQQLLVTFPNRETRSLSTGPSSIISKAVVEVFAPSFLERPAVLWLSTSDNKVVARDDQAAASIGLKIQADKDLPDIILADLGPQPLLIFIEVVATDGAITERRQKSLYDITDAAGFDRSLVCFVTAYLDRDSSGFKKTMSNLAWNSFAWFASEPENLVIFRQGATFLSKLITSSYI